MDAKELFLAHFEKLALGVASLALVWVLGGTLLGGGTEDRAQTVARYNKELARKKTAAKASLEERRRTEPPPTLLAAVQRELTGGAFPQSFPAWLFHKRPKILTKVIGQVLPDPIHRPPVSFQGKPGLGRISMSWEDGRNEYVEVVTVKIFRRLGERGEWKEIGEVDGGVHSYQDREAEPRKQYWYMIESHAQLDSSKTIRRYNKGEIRIELPEKMVVLRSIAIGPFQTQRDTYLDVIQVQAPTIEDRIKGRQVSKIAWMKVYKYFADDGVWRVSPQLVLHSGDKVGDQVRLRGKDIDFSTGFVLKDVKFKKLEKQGPGGFSFKVDAHVAVVQDVRSGETFEINNQVRDKGLEDVIDQLKAARPGGSKKSGSSKGDGE